MARRSEHQAGFTLVEMLVALALVGIVFSVVFGSLQLSVKVTSVAKGRAENMETVTTAFRVIRRFVERAYPLIWADGKQKRYAFEGQSNSLLLTTLLPDYPSVAGPYSVRLYTHETEAGRALWLSLAPYRQDRDQSVKAEAIEDVILLPAPADVSFEYFGSPDGKIDPRWSGHWAAKGRLPRLVRISVAGAWPPLTIPLGIDMDASCMVPAAHRKGLCRLDDGAAEPRRPGGTNER